MTVSLTVCFKINKQQRASIDHFISVFIKTEAKVKQQFQYHKLERGKQTDRLDELQKRNVYIVLNMSALDNQHKLCWFHRLCVKQNQMFIIL